MTEFEKELENLINKHCLENQSDTPDFILAAYLCGCLDAFTQAARQRDHWHVFEPWGRKIQKHTTEQTQPSEAPHD